MNSVEEMSAIADIEKIADRLPGVSIVHDLSGKVIWMSPRGLHLLNIKLEDVVQFSAPEYYSKFFNEEDAKDYVPKILGLLERNNNDEYCSYFQQVRYSETADWTWHFSSCKIWQRDENGKPRYTITMAFPIEGMHHMTAKAAKILEENNFLRNNYGRFIRLSKREKEVLIHLTKGKSAAESAEILFIAISTIESHRKNIRRKLNTSSFDELCKYARAFDLI